MKTVKRIGVICLCLMLIFSFTMMSFAEGASPKEEVVYIMTDAGGGVGSVNVVNIFSGGNIVDYGDYTEVKSLTTEDEIDQSGDTVTFSTEAETVYYQGTMKENTEIPWNISIKYFIDGKEYAPDEVGGKSGKLEIKFNVTKNDKCATNFFSNYALQAEFTLDTKRCKKIAAADATVANEGANKLLTYTILPGRGINTTITAEVKNFRMDAVEINGVQLNLSLGNIDTSSITGQVAQLIAATKALSAGTTALYTGSNALKAGSSRLNSASSEVNSGVAALDRGIGSLQSGILEMKSGVSTLNSKSSALVSGSSQVKSALSQMQHKISGVNISPGDIGKMSSSSSAIRSTLNSINSKCSNLSGTISSQTGSAQSAIGSLNSSIGALQTIAANTEDPYIKSQIQEQIAVIQRASSSLSSSMNGLNSTSSQVSELYYASQGLGSQYAQIDSAISQLSSFAGEFNELKTGLGTLVARYTELDLGLNEYTNGISSVSAGYSDLSKGVSQLASGSKELLNGTGALTSGSRDLYNGVINLCEGTSKLAAGTSQLQNGASGVNPQGTIDSILSSIGGSQSNPTSFVSPKNTAVSSVQFVIKTDSVEPAYEEEKTETDSTKLSWWQKILKLFGFFK